MDFIRTSILLMLVASCFTAFEGPTIINLTHPPYKMAMSDDGSIIVMTYSTLKDAEVFVKAIDGFVLGESLPSSIGAQNRFGRCWEWSYYPPL